MKLQNTLKVVEYIQDNRQKIEKTLHTKKALLEYLTTIFEFRVTRRVLAHIVKILDLNMKPFKKAKTVEEKLNQDLTIAYNVLTLLLINLEPDKIAEISRAFEDTMPPTLDDILTAARYKNAF